MASLTRYFCQVPYDQPLASHDMLLRFVGADLLGAAGPAAQVPSRVGDEQEAVLGQTHTNGTAVGGPALDVDSTTRLPFSSDSAIEALVNAGSAIVIIALMVLAGLVFYVVRRRVNRRAKAKGALLGESLGAEDSQYEMDPLVDEGEEEEGYRDGAEESAAEEGRARVSKLAARQKLGEDALIFEVGEEEDEEEDGNGKKG